MLSERAQRDILIELLKASRFEVYVSDDHYMDCQLVMIDRCFLAVFDFSDAVLNAERFQPIPNIASKWVMDFTPYGYEVVRPMTEIPAQLLKAVISNKVIPLKGSTGRTYFMKQKYLRIIHYDERHQTLYVRKSDQGKPVMYYLWDNEKEELDAMIAPFRMEVKEDENGAS